MMRKNRFNGFGLNRVYSYILVALTCLVLSIFGNNAFANTMIKQPNVAGQFYDDNPKVLSRSVKEYLKKADVTPYQSPVEIIIAPHAGYFYSGSVAGFSFKAVSQFKYKTIIILAPSHFYGFDGISVWSKGGFQTPLGLVSVDEEFAQKLIGSHSKIIDEPQAFEKEHSLEVEIPFLQETFEGFNIVPVVMGQAPAGLLKDFAAQLQKQIGERTDVLIVVSTDLSHYHDDQKARRMDKAAIAAIKDLDVEKIWREGHLKSIEMCGLVPVVTALIYAKQKGLTQVDVLKYANSSEASGDKSRVVGYTAIVIRSDAREKNGAENLLSHEQKQKLLKLARKQIEAYVRGGKRLKINEADPRLKLKEGSFVTIHKKGRLRGCIGNILGSGPLVELVRDMAIASATQDPRFPPVNESELSLIDVEVSVLSVPYQIKSVDEIELGKHGVIVKGGARNSGVFLPQVADETKWSKEEFLSQLCSQKAGLARDCWKDPKTRIEIFTAQVFSEEDY